MRSAPWRLGLLVLLLGALGAESRASDLDSEPGQALNLFQRVARADLVVHVRVHDGSLRFALVDVLEALKGDPPAQRLRVAFRDYNFYRKPGAEPIIFPNGQQEVLFLVKYDQVRRKEKNKDIYELFPGAEGRITVPEEGSAMILEAVRRLAGLAGKDPVAQIDGLTSLLESDNPVLLGAALDEVRRLRVADASLYGRLVALLRSPAPGVRGRALRLVAEVFASTGGDGRDDQPDQGGVALAAVLERARNDPNEDVRVEAVAALAAWPVRRQVEEDLKAIAALDPAQAVRYEAQRILFGRHGP